MSEQYNPEQNPRKVTEIPPERPNIISTQDDIKTQYHK